MALLLVNGDHIERSVFLLNFCENLYQPLDIEVFDDTR
jgi:hypothetical protein